MNRSSRVTFCGLVLAMLAGVVSCSVAGAGTVVLIGFWPPTNEMLRQFSTNPARNPGGWMGRNWQGLGHDIHAFFPEFPPDGQPFNDAFGSPGFSGSSESDFRVDYQDTSADFWNVVDTLNPCGIVTFSWGGEDDRWEIERVEGGHAGGSTPELDWIGDGDDVPFPTQSTVDPRSWNAISTYRNGNRLHSQLPVDDIVAATSALGLANVVVDDIGTSGRFLSGFLGLHGLYYHSLHADPAAPFRTIAAGHIHVGSALSVANAESLSEATLTETLSYINRVVPEPGSLMLVTLACVGMGFVRRLAMTAFLVAGAMLAAAPTHAGHDDPLIPAERLEVRAVTGEGIPFADLMGPDGRAVCFAFLHPSCPLAQEYAPVLEALVQRFAVSGIRFVGVVCECDDPAEVTAYRAKFGITFPIHLDTEFTLADALCATTTPQAVLVDRGRRVRYTGRIDDRYKIRGVMTPGDAQPELANAIEDLLAGREIREPQTDAAGCPLDRPERPVTRASATAAPGPTFFKDVLPFLRAQCQACHSPDQAGPFNLLTYDDAVDWAEVAIEEIEARRMPPAQIESDLDYAWTKPPTAADLAMLRKWVAADKPEGNPADAPTLPPLPESTAFQEDLGPPDIVLEQPEPTQLGSHGNDVYRNIVFPLNRPEDLRLRAIQFLPGNRKVVHHALIGHLPRETAEESIRKYGGREGFDHPDDRGGGFQDPHGIGFRVPPVRPDGQPRASFVSGYVPGVPAAVAPADAALVIPSGCDVVAQTHYVRTGKLETDSSRIGIWLDEQPPPKVMNMIYLSGDFAVVPRGVADFRVRGSYTLPHDADYVGVVPHAHQLARWIEIKAHLPGVERPLLVLRVPQWDYNWQSSYTLRQPRRFPAGTRFEAEVSYDNSAANPRNPFDPPQHVWHNESIHDEMLLPMFTFASEKPLDAKGKAFKQFICALGRSRFLRRLVDHRYRYVADPQGNITLSPDYDPDDHRY